MSLEDHLHASLSLYMRAPAWVRLAVGHTYRRLPAQWRHGRLHAVHAEHARHDSSAHWDELSCQMEVTLAAAAQVPAYAAWHSVLTRRTPVWERLSQLPLLSKPAIKADLRGHVVAGATEAQLLPMFTGGSTEHPMRFYLERGVTRPKESAYIAHIEQAALRAAPGDWTLSLRGRTVQGAAEAGGKMWSVEPIKRHLLFSSDHLEAHHMPAHVDALRTLRPPVIQAFPSALYPLARWLDAHPCPAFSERVTGVLLTSESVYAFQMALFARVFPNAALVQHYGHSERVLMATALGAAPYQFFPRYGYPELVDPEGRTITEPGVLGEIVGTSFDNAVMPFVRYRTGDMGMWRTVPQPGVGEARFEMSRIEGRLQEFVVCRDQRLVSITTLGAAHFAELAPADAIQFEQHRPGDVLLRVATSQTLCEGSLQRIAQAVNTKTQGGCQVQVELVDRIARTARGKHRMLIQHLDLSAYLGAAVLPGASPALASDTNTDTDAFTTPPSPQAEEQLWA
jgi:phenylacetate-CoA ligase